MSTLEQISKKPNVMKISVVDYDFETQQLFTSGMPAAWQTGNSMQTFDGNGRPIDAKSDDND